MDEKRPLELNRAVPGGRVEMFAVQDDDYRGRWFYRFQYYHPDAGEILRYDNAHDDPAIGRHHRHVSSGGDSELTFHSITAHVAQFLQEVAQLTAVEEDHD